MKGLAVLLADDDMVAVNKPAGVASVHDGTRPDEADLAALLRARFATVLPVHRLDRDTSGVIVFALTAEAHRDLSMQFERRETAKTYHALVAGAPGWEAQVIDAPLRSDADRRHRTMVDPAHGKPAVTHVRVLRRLGPFTLIEARPQTGRAHQIRAHLALLGFPIACDALYGDGAPIVLSRVKKDYRPNGDERPLIARLALHACALELRHPRTGAPLRLEAPYPKDFGAVVTQLGKGA